MSDFWLYLQLGFEHISDFEGYDHMVFLLALCAVYSLRDWKKVALLVTAFTLGHSLTLALAVLEWVRADSGLIEFLIPLTIFLTGLYNLFVHPKQTEPERKFFWNYPLAALFGLIHGLGFSGYLRALLGAEEELLRPLLAFNLGLEIGQVAIVLVLLFLHWVATSRLKLPTNYWRWISSGIAMAIALFLMAQRFAEA